MPTLSDITNINSGTHTADYNIPARTAFESVAGCTFPEFTEDSRTVSLNSLTSMISDLTVKYPKILFTGSLGIPSSGGGGGGGGPGAQPPFNCDTDVIFKRASINKLLVPCTATDETTALFAAYAGNFLVGEAVGITNLRLKCATIDLNSSGGTLQLKDGGGSTGDYWASGINLTDGSGTVTINCSALSGKTAYFQAVQFCSGETTQTAYVLMTTPE